MPTKTQKRPLDLRKLETSMREEYAIRHMVPPHRIIGRMAIGVPKLRRSGPATIASLQKEGIKFSLFNPYLANVKYGPFRERVQREALTESMIADGIHLLGGVSCNGVKVYRTGLRLSKLLSESRGTVSAVYLLLGNVDSAKSIKGNDVTGQLNQHHQIIAAQFGDPAYEKPTLHFGAVSCPQELSTPPFLKDFLLDQFETIIPETASLSPVSLVKLPPLPD